MRAKCHKLAGCLLALALWAPLPAQGQPSATDRAAAEALYDQALRLMQSQQYSEACPKLEESQRLDPGVGTLLYLGHCYQEQGRLASAWATFKEAAYAAADAGQKDREAMATERADALKPQLATLTLKVTEPDLEGMEVSRDGEPQRQAAWGVPVPVDPGSHRIEARAPNRRAWTKTLEVRKGPGNFEIVVPALDPETTHPAAATAAPPPPDPKKPTVPSVIPAPSVAAEHPAEAESPPANAQRTWGFVTLGAGGVGLAVGGVFAILAASADAQADEECRPDNPKLCSEKGVTLGDQAVTNAGIATLAAGIGAALAITGGVLVFTAPSDDPERSPALGVGAAFTPQGATLGLQGQW